MKHQTTNDAARSAARRTSASRSAKVAPAVSDRVRIAIVAACALAGGVAAAFADGAPTELAAWDAFLRFALAAAFVVAVSASPTWLAIVVATAATALIGDTVWLGPAALGLLLAIGSGVQPRYRFWLLPLAAALAIQALLRLPPIGFFGLPSLIAGAAVVLALVTVCVSVGGPTSRYIALVVFLGAFFMMLVTAVGASVLYSAKDNVDAGIAAARSGLSAARGGDPAAVVDKLEVAAESLTAAQERAESLWAQPLRLLPVVAQHRNAVVVATRQGGVISRQAADTVIDADISSIAMDSGSVDLAALAAMEDDLARTVDLLESGVGELDAAQSPWLVSLISSSMTELTDELRDVLPDARLAADAARVVPGMLGQDAPRRYFVAFATPAESRELGGYTGNWAIIEFDAGSVTEVDAGRVSDLYELTRSKSRLLTDAGSTTEAYPLWYVDRANPGYWPQNLTGSPRLSVVANGARELLDGIDGGSIDGFIYFDAYATEAMLQLTGPLQVEGVDNRINANNVLNFLFDEQYRLDNRQELKSESGDIFEGAFERVLDTALPGPERLGKVFGPVARQGRLQVATFDDDENAFLQSLKLQRDFGFSASTADAFAVVQTSGLRNKLGLYSHRDVTYDVTVDDSGQLRGTVTVELSLDVPDDAPEYTLGGDDPGLNVLFLSLYTPHQVVSVTIDGQPAELAYISEFGYGRNEVTVETRSGETRVVTYEITGQVDPARAYDLSVWQQPLVNNDQVHVSASLLDEPAADIDFELIENVVLAFDDGVQVSVAD